MNKNNGKQQLNNEIDQRYEYYAFISYRHVDMRWGRWIQQSIESYRIPTALVKSDNLPKRITPVCRDETDLTGGSNVYALLDEKIHKSKYLIVICSKSVAQSPKYIAYEINKFLEFGNPKTRIIPVIIDGVPNSENPENECLPPVLKDMGEECPLGIDLTKNKKHDCKLKLIAALLQIELNSIRNHDAVRRQKLRTHVAVICCIFSILIAAFVAWQLLQVNSAQMREKNTTAEYLLRNGNPIRANSVATEVSASLPAALDSRISEKSDQVRYLSELRTPLMQVTEIDQYTTDSEIFFDTSGCTVIEQKGNSVKKFDIRGNLLMNYIADGFNTSIKALSPDGVHAAIAKFDSDTIGMRSVLSLVNMETNESLFDMVQSNRFDENDVIDLDFKDVTGAKFSPDGKTVAAYCVGGYFNDNDSLLLWDVTTGKLCCELPGSLLGTRVDDGIRDNQVVDFEFIGNDVAHWTGGAYHVYYSLSEEIYWRTQIEVDQNDPRTGMSRYDLNVIKEDERFLLTCTDGQTEQECAENYFVCDYGSHYALVIGVRYNQESAYIGHIGVTDLLCASEVEMTDVSSGMYTGYDIISNDTSDIVYLICSNSLKTYKSDSVYRMQVSRNTLSVPTTNASFMNARDSWLIGESDGADYLCIDTEAGTKLILVERENMVLRSCAMEVDYNALKNAAFADGILGTWMICKDSGNYVLYEMSHAAVQMDSDVGFEWENGIHSSSPICAASDDGRLICKALQARYAIWMNEEMILFGDFPCKITAIGTDADGSAVYIAGRERLEVYSASGELLRSIDFKEDEPLLTAKLSTSGDSVYVLQQIIKAPARMPYTRCLMKKLSVTSDEPPIVFSDCVYRSNTLDPELSFAVSPDGTRLCAIGVHYYDEEQYKFDREICVFDAQTGKQLVNLLPDADTDSVYSQPQFCERVWFDGQGQVVANCGAVLWTMDAETLRVIQTINLSHEPTGEIQFLDNGDLIYAADNLYIVNNEKNTLETIAIDDAEWSLVSDIQATFRLSSDGKWLAVTDSLRTELYTIPTYEYAYRLSALPIQIIYLGTDRVVYETGTGLFSLSLPTK